MKIVDLNLDAAESLVALQDGSEGKLYDLVSSINIACGGHAGDAETMAIALEMADERGLRVGAHPSFPDRDNFGRKALNIPAVQLTASLTKQIEDLAEFAAKRGMKLTHVKPHGALYNLAAFERNYADIVIEAVRAVDPRLALVGLAGSPFLQAGRDEGFKVLAEGFVDRGYTADGRLIPRDQPGALFDDPQAASRQALSLVGKVDTLCIHGDTPKALDIARAVHAGLRMARIQIGFEGE